MTRRRLLLEQPLPAEVRALLAPLERAHVEIAMRMNREPAKAVWTTLQRGAATLWHGLALRRLLHVEGYHHVREAYARGAILFVANHRTYYDLFVVSSLLHRTLPGRKRLYFPVTGQYYYQSVGGMLLNQFFANWAMFPPLFALPTHRPSDQYALEVLAELCAQGPGHILGIHPEGARNLDPDPYSFMRHKPGTGRIIHAARPIVIPTFIAGLDNDMRRMLRRNWRGGERVRLWFDAPMALDEFLALPAKGSTYVRITDAVMARVRALAEADRAAFGTARPAPVPPSPPPP